MPIKWDALQEQKAVPSLVPAAVTGTVTGVVIDARKCSYVTHEIQIGAVTTLDGTDLLTPTINESNTATNSTTLSSGTALPAGNVLGVEYVTGGGFSQTWSSSFPKAGVGGISATLPVINDSTKFQSGTVIRIWTQKNFDFQQLLLTATGSPSLLLGATAVLSGFEYVNMQGT
jgi:hypothetical protein